MRGVSASARAGLFNGIIIYCKAFNYIALKSNREFWSYLSPFSRNFRDIPRRIDRKRRSRRFRISNLRQRGRIIAQDMAIQIFVLHALGNISPSRRPICTVIGPVIIYTSHRCRPSPWMLLLGQSIPCSGLSKLIGWKNDGQLATNNPSKQRLAGAHTHKHCIRQDKENVSLCSIRAIHQATIEKAMSQFRNILLEFPLVKKKSSSFWSFASNLLVNPSLKIFNGS